MAIMVKRQGSAVFSTAAALLVSAGVFLLTGCSAANDPSVSSISPANVQVGSADVQVTVIGKGFTDRYIQVGTAPPYGNFVRPRPADVDTKAVFTVPAAQFAVAGTLPVVILGDLPNRTNYVVFGSGVSMTVTAPSLSISNVSPSTVPQGLASTETITGTGFLPSSTLILNGVARTATYISSTQLSFVLSQADTSAVGTLSVSVSNAAINGGSSNAGTISVTRPLPTEQHSYGDSITAGLTLAQATQAFPYLLGSSRGLTVKDQGISGIETCPIFWSEISGTDPRPTASTNVLFTAMSGSNDINTSGVGNHEAVFNTCQQAIITWLGTPIEFRVKPGDTAYRVGGACTTSGTCSGAGTVSASIVTTGAPIYLWYEINDTFAAGSGFALTIDGVAQGTYLSRPAAGVSGAGNGRGLALVRTTIGAGSHAVNLAASGTNNILGIGSLPSGPYGTQPTILLGDLPNQVAGQERDSVANQQIYSGDIRANVALLIPDGLDVRLVPVRRYLGTAASDYNDNLHPNAGGQQKLAQAFSDVLGTLGSRQTITTTLVSGATTPLPILDLSFVAPSATATFSLPSVSAVGRPVTYYNNSSSGAHALISGSGADQIMIYNGLTATPALDVAPGHSATFYPDSSNGRYLAYPH